MRSRDRQIKAPRVRKALIAIAVPSAMLALAACSSGQPTRSSTPAPLAGSSIGGPFTLTDQNGRTVSDRDYAGKYRIMYFGYTYCPDVCPTEMQTIAAGLKLFAQDHAATAAKVVPIFVTVDPARDTPDVLKQWVSAFGPNVVGLTGSAQAIAKVAKEYAVYYQKGDVTPGGGYLVNHSSQAYLFGPDGKPIELLPADSKGSPQQVADDLARWVT